MSMLSITRESTRKLVKFFAILYKFDFITDDCEHTNVIYIYKYVTQNITMYDS